MEAVTLAFSADAPPLSILAAAKVAGVNISVDAGVVPSGSPPELRLSSGLVLFIWLCRYSVLLKICFFLIAK
jgi:hypothetical protein